MDWLASYSAYVSKLDGSHLYWDDWGSNWGAQGYDTCVPVQDAIEPWLYGSSTGLSAFAIILAAIFWTLLWGPVGLVLATPLTVCMVVIGRYVPRLEFLGLILGSEPVLTPDERLYQRLLAGNVEEAVEMAEAETDGTSSLTFYEAVALPALRRAQNDRRRSADIELRRNIADSMIAVVREVEDHVGQGRDKVDPSGPTARAAEARARVLCIGGRTELDLAAAEIVAGRLSERGVRAVTAAPISVSASAIGQLDLTHAEVLCISYFHPRPWVYVRYVCRRIGRRAPRLPIIVCCWNLASDAGEPAEREPTLGANATLVITLEAAEQKIVDALSAEAAPPADASVRPHDRTRLETLRQLGLAVGKGPVFERLAASLSEELGTSATLVVPIDERTAPNGTVAASAQDKPDIPLSELICAEVVSARATVVVDDAAADRRFSSNAELLEKGIRSIVAAPLRSPTGDVLGALVAFDSDKRSFSDGDIRLLEAAAAELVSTLSDPPVERSSRRD